ncbi:MAG: serine/threonine-protein kinase [Zavarzinella sp.]
MPPTPTIDRTMQPFPGVKLHHRLGVGAFGEVWEGSYESGRRVALKFMGGKNGVVSQELKTIQALQRITHPHLLPTYQVCSIPKYIVIIMELADGNLLELCQVFKDEYGTGIPAELLGIYMAQVASALDHLNSRKHRFDHRTVGFVHRDIKPSNILLSGEQAKLCDFGFCTPIHANYQICHASGTPDFSPPEFYSNQITPNSDQYSFAVTYYYLRTGELPFPAVTKASFSHPSERKSPNLGGVSAVEAKILERALNPQPQHRWASCTELMQQIFTGLGMTYPTITENDATTMATPVESM